MTRRRTFKQLVRARMAKTGESFTAARAVLLGTAATSATSATPTAPAQHQPVLATSDATVRARTGRGWEEWFDALDDWGAQDRSHRDIARWIADQLQVVPLAWAAQAVTISYERARKARAVGEHADGYTVTASKTVTVPVDQLFAAFLEPSRRASWAPDLPLQTRATTRNKSAHFDVVQDGSRVHVHFDALGETRSRISVQHARLAGSTDADRYKAAWRKALSDLAATVIGGDHDA